MTVSQAKDILITSRSWARDDEDPEVAEALALCQKDADLAKWFADHSARQEALRGAYDPEYLYYTLGKLEILKLREDYRKQEGANFTLSKFHNELLRHGAPPLRLLREVLLKDRRIWEQVL